VALNEGEPPPRQPRAHSRRTLVLLVTPIVIMSIVGMVADAIAPTLIESHPLLQMFLNPRNRYLILASPNVDPIPFFVVGFVRLILTDPLGYLLGYLYGDGALRWIERKLGEDRQTGWIAMLERFFSKASYLIVLIAPNIYICLLAGATGMRPAVFATLNVSGTIVRLVIIRLVGEAFEEPLQAVVRFIGRNSWWLLALSVAVVGLQALRGRRRGAIEFETPNELAEEIEEELEQVEAERAGGDEDDSPPAPAR
jgi:membrane protein DedA with SNARE-associated domain